MTTRIAPKVVRFIAPELLGARVTHLLNKPISRITSAVPSTTVVKNPGNAVISFDFFRGLGKIEGVVTSQDVPVKRKVVLLEKTTNRLVRSVWSNEDGSYSFRNLNETLEYIVYVLDHTNQFEAIIFGSVVPKVDVSDI